MSFDKAIAPVTPQEFFEQSFEKKHLVIRRGQADYYSSLLTSADIDWAVSTLGLSVPEVNVVQADREISATDFAYDSGFIDPVAVNQLFAEGATIIMSNLQERLPKLAMFCRELEKVFSARVQTNIYMTPANSQGFKAHYDGHDVLVLQVEGTKEWRIYDTPVHLPLEEQAFNPHDVPIGEMTDSFILEPGDMVYVPRGLTHDAVSTDQTSLHITTGLMMRSWADVMVEAVRKMALSDAEFREGLPPGFANEGFDSSGAEAKFAALLGKLSGATLDSVLNEFREDFIATRLPRAHGQLAQMARLDGLGPNSVMGARPTLIYRLTDVPAKGDQPDSVALSCQGTVITLPAYAREPLEYAISTPSFTLADLPGDLDDAGKTVLLRRLVREGLVYFIE
ncbi:cupin domain-containing protein [Nioella sp. MMSF_3534]|uniref:cupin domain-containing protein n=1 Tax=Nioella sp. MMSF_3534 TaxID=3046720 RepID=UPI00273EAD6E|nr:cupin domain-containing protein [Nioella sp. MMSF_3534]